MLDRGDTTQAYDKARAAVETRPNDPDAALTLSRAASAAGHPLSHHEQLARYFLLKGNLVAAYQEYETAYTYTANDPRAQARIESTLQEIERRAGQTEE